MSEEVGTVAATANPFRVLIGMPWDGKSVHLAAAKAFFHPCRKDSAIEFRLMDHGGCAVLMNHNAILSKAIDLYEAGEIDALAILHGDIGANTGWLDDLYAPMLEKGLDLIAASVPIKDDRGLTSTAVDDMEDDYAPRRLTQRQVAELPEVFTDSDIGGPILLNTGMMLLKFGPWVLTDPAPIHFEFVNCIKKKDGVRFPWFKPDDWQLSRMCRKLGLKLACTKSIPLHHFGDKVYKSTETWGWKEDWQNGPNAPHRRAAKRGFKIGAELAGTKVVTLGDNIRTINGGRNEDGVVVFTFEDGTECLMEECFPLTDSVGTDTEAGVELAVA